MTLASCLLFPVIFLGAADTAPGDLAGAEFLDDRRDLFLHVQQGWGELGINVSAHAAGQSPLPLQIGDKKYAHGLGHHAPGEIVVDLGGRYARFEAEVGLQALPCESGSVTFQVFVDEKKAFDSEVMRVSDAARQVSIPVAGAQELRLVVTDAGDGITCDCANWAEARLIADPSAGPAGGRQDFDVARFARVITSDPARVDGAHSTRVQECRAEDVFLEWGLPPDEQGHYTVAAPANSPRTIGLRWIERRLIRSLVLECADPLPEISPDRVQVQFWVGESPWQGGWKPLKGPITAEQDCWTIRADTRDNPDLRRGTWKIRWILPAGTQPLIVQRLLAFTPVSLGITSLLVHFDDPSSPRPVEIEIYNGEIVEPSVHVGRTRVSIDAGSSARLSIRYCRHRPWQSDRATVRFRLPTGGFAVALDDLLRDQAVYVPAFNVLVALADAGVDVAEYRKRIAGRETVLQEVRRRPDQTMAQALERVHHGTQDRGPTLLSLACDNRKFIVHRDGTVQFALPSEPTEAAPAHQQQYPCQFKPAFGSGRHAGLTRRLEGGWLPAPVVSVTEADVTYRMCTFVTPYDEQSAAADNPWLNRKPLFVAVITAENTGSRAAPASLKLGFLADAQKNRSADITLADGWATVQAHGQLLAVYDTRQAKNHKAVQQPDTQTIQATLEPHEKFSCRIYIPGWAMKPDQGKTLLGDGTLFDRFTAYWERVFSTSMQIRVPDPLLMNVIRASQVHCLIAARNEEAGRRIAPWIASVSYGPLESEANSIIRGMDFLGHREFARRSLDFFIHRYDPSGFLTTGYTLMGTGWHLWTLGEHYALTRDTEWLTSVSPKVAAVCTWIAKQRDKTRRSPGADGPVLESGLMPPGVMADWNAFAYYFCLNGYYCAGLRSAAGALRDIGYPGADVFLHDADEFREAILRAYHAVQAQMPAYRLCTGAYVPGYPSQLLPGPTGPFFPGEDGNRSWAYDVELGAHHLVPQGVLPADGREVSFMMDHMEDVQFLAEGWFDYPAEASQKDPFNLGGFAKVQPYYARNAEIYALRDDVKPFVRSYFNALASLLSLENLSLQEHFRGVGAWNKTHETGYFLYQTRLMLVMERGGELWLAPLVTNQWLQDGMVVEVQNAPTVFGPVSYRIRSSVRQGVIDATIDPPTRASPERIVLRLRHPEGRPIRSVSVDGQDHRAFDAAGEWIRITPGRAKISVQAQY